MSIISTNSCTITGYLPESNVFAFLSNADTEGKITFTIDTSNADTLTFNCLTNKLYRVIIGPYCNYIRVDEFDDKLQQYKQLTILNKNTEKYLRQYISGKSITYKCVIEDIYFNKYELFKVNGIEIDNALNNISCIISCNKTKDVLYNEPVTCTCNFTTNIPNSANIHYQWFCDDIAINCTDKIYTHVFDTDCKITCYCKVNDKYIKSNNNITLSAYSYNDSIDILTDVLPPTSDGINNVVLGNEKKDDEGKNVITYHTLSTSNDTYNLYTIASGDSQLVLNHQWYKDGVPVNSSYVSSTITDTNTTILTTVYSTNSKGEYYCRLFNHNIFDNTIKTDINTQTIVLDKAYFECTLTSTISLSNIYVIGVSRAIPLVCTATVVHPKQTYESISASVKITSS